MMGRLTVTHATTLPVSQQHRKWQPIVKWSTSGRVCKNAPWMSTRSHHLQLALFALLARLSVNSAARLLSVAISSRLQAWLRSHKGQ